MRLFSYVVRYDMGFAPNPFEGYCTLATCKYKIRNTADVGDWVVGTGSVENVGNSKLIFLMKVTEKLTFDKYWEDERFESKKPNMNGSLKVRNGDNIYRKDRDNWIQANSKHSNEDGSENKDNKDYDLESINVLISDYFYYFGKSAIVIPNEFKSVINPGIGHKSNFQEELIEKFVKWVEGSNDKGMIDFPSQFDEDTDEEENFS